MSDQWSQADIRQYLPLFPLLILAACFPFDEGPPDATKEQVNSILATCGVTIKMVEHQNQQSDRRLVSIAYQEPDRFEKAKCLRLEEDKRGVGFTMFGP